MLGAAADDDGALTFLHSDVPCVVQAVELSEGLVVLSVTCVLAWDLPAGRSQASTQVTESTTRPSDSSTACTTQGTSECRKVSAPSSSAAAPSTPRP